MKFLKEIYLCLIGPEVDDIQPDPFKKEFKLILHVDTINGRKKLNFKDEAAINAEIELSRKMCDKKIPLELYVSMKMSSKDKGKTVNIDMIDHEVGQKKSALLNFGNFFAVNIPTALKYYLKKRWEETVNK
jgi:hypothetical protein